MGEEDQDASNLTWRFPSALTQKTQSDSKVILIKSVAGGLNQVIMLLKNIE